MAALSLLVVMALLGGTLGLKISIDKEHEHVVGSANLIVRCTADTPITRCQMRLEGNPPVDLSSGRLSKATGYQYLGDGLEAGHCGAIIDKSLFRVAVVVQCRVISDGTDWEYATMSVSTDAHHIPLTTESRMVVVPPGGKANLLFHTKEEINGCKFYHPMTKTITSLTNELTCDSKADSFCYHGDGIENKQCGISIKNITHKSAGIFLFSVGTKKGWDNDFIQLIVSKPPENLLLTAYSTRNRDGSAVLYARCTMSSSRPVANITWTLDNETVKGGSVSTVADEEWAWQFEDHSIIQLLTLPFDVSSVGKELSCTAHHVALPTPLRSNTFLIEMQGEPGKQFSPTPAPRPVLAQAPPHLGNGILQIPVGDDHRHVVAVERLKKHVCSGAIIDSHWALTSARCVLGMEANDIELRSSASRKETGGVLHPVHKIVIHPDFNTFWEDNNDIALLNVLGGFTTLDFNIQVIPIKTSLPLPGNLLTVSGYGNHDDLTSELVPLASHSECKLDWNIVDGAVYDQVLCAGYRMQNIINLNSEVGSPLIFRKKLVGIRMWVPGRMPNIAKIYINTANTNIWAWIHQTTTSTSTDDNTCPCCHC